MKLPASYQPAPRLVLGEHTLDGISVPLAMGDAPVLLVGTDREAGGVLVWLFGPEGEALVEASEVASTEAAAHYDIEVADEGFGLLGVRARRATALALAPTGESGAKVMTLDLRPLLIDAHLEDGVLQVGNSPARRASEGEAGEGAAVGFDLSR